jgi:hypothetical protein
MEKDMASAELGGLIGAIVGTVLGILGGVIGSWFSIRNTDGPRERKFVIQASLVGWLLLGLFIAGIVLLPSPHRFFLWVPYAVLLPLGIAAFNRQQARIRRDEQQQDSMG